MRSNIDVDPMLPRMQATWKAFITEFKALAEVWGLDPVPINRFGGDDGYSSQRIRVPWKMARLEECRLLLNRVGRVSGESLEGWRFEFWNDEEFAETYELTLVAVDPSGYVHDIRALADGRDPIN